MKTSHKKNRPFDFKLIDLVEPHPVLYQRQMGLSTYEAMKAKNLIWQAIAKDMKSSIEFCIMRWGNLRGQFQKELRNCRELCPKQGIIRGSNWPYLTRLSFLESTVQFNRPKRTRENLRKFKLQEAKFEFDDAMDNSNTFTDLEIKSCNDIIDEVWECAEEETYGVDHTVIVDDERLKPVANYIIEVPPTTNADVFVNDLNKMPEMIESLDANNKSRVERRIMAYLCKCQLRALNNLSVDDLVI